MEYRKIRLLMDKTIVGIGGKFSSGKSRFINSFLESEHDGIILPENQAPTTSIPTYVIGGEKDEIHAFVGNRVEKLDIEAMQAITHRFYDQYKIGFSRFVDTIVVHTPAFPESLKDKIVFLDTPGYNKADSDTKEALTDEHVTVTQLKAVDYLIWLVSIENGVVHDRDIEFMQAVPRDTPILIVFNKADKLLEDKVREIVESSRQILAERGLNVFGVTAYSSQEQREYLNGHFIQDFLEIAGNNAAEKQGIRSDLEEIIATVDEAFEKTISNLRNRRSKLGDDISAVRQDILGICSLAHFYGRSMRQQRYLMIDQKKFRKVADEIQEAFGSLINRKG